MTRYKHTKAKDGRFCVYEVGRYRNILFDTYASRRVARAACATLNAGIDGRGWDAVRVIFCFGEGEPTDKVIVND